MNLQQDLFKPLMAAYSRGEPLRNDQLYESLCTDNVIPEGALLERVQIGKDRALHNPVTRKIRWAQQGLRALGLLEKVPGERGVWRSTAKARGELTPAPRRTVLLGFSTKLGLALWGDCADVFTGFNEPIHCCLTSPPYCIDRPRAYGGVAESAYVDFICNAMEPFVKNLVPGGTIALNISQDAFVKGLPARSLTPGGGVIAMNARLGLWRVDSLIWSNARKAPGPIGGQQKASVAKHRL